MKTDFRFSALGRLSRWVMLPVFLAAALGSAPLSSAHAIGSTITVDTLDGGLVDGNAECSLAEAIVNANVDAGGTPYTDCALGAGDDDIVFDGAAVSGTITLTQSLPTIDDPDDETTWINGDGDITIDGDGTYQIVRVSGYAGFRDLIIQNANNAFSGGAVYNDGGANLTVERTLFLGNHANGTGGAIDNGGTLLIDRSTFSSNSAAGGGGAIYTSGTLTISNSTFYNNSTSSGVGGGIRSDSFATNIYSSTFSNNASPAGTGAALASTLGTAYLYNSILANSTSGYDCDADGSGAAGGSYNLIEDDNCGFTDGAGGMILGDDPRLGALVSVPAYFTLQNNSPALDAGNNSFAVGTLDEPGNPRRSEIPWAVDTGAGTSPIIDLGAYEHQINCPGGLRLYVDADATGEALGISWTDAFPDLQMALYTIASCGSPSDVWVAGGVYKPDGASSGDRNLRFTIPPGTRLYGGFNGTETSLGEQDPGANVTILSGDIDDNDTNVDGNNIAEDYTSVSGSNSYHVVYFDGTIAPITGGTALDGFVITAGLANSSGLNAEGAGMLCLAPGAADTCSPQLTNLLISGNLAAYGGGMFIEVGVSTSTGSPSLQDVTFRGNRATGNGGGVFNHSSGVGNPSFTNVTFSNNSAGGHGGGMANAGNGGGTSPSLQNVTFHSNSAGGSGGGMWNVGYGGVNGVSSPVLKNVTFTGNSADKGGAMENQTLDPDSVSSPVLYNVILWADSATTSGDEIMNEAVASSTVNPSLDHVVVEGGCPAGSSCANLSTADPMLGSLQDNGGFTETVALGAGSAAIDAGDDTVCAAAPVNGLDQRGVTRPQGTQCDIGAFEKEVNGDTTGVFRPSSGALFMKNSNATGFADLYLTYGIPGDYPVVGDWDGNGSTTLGVFHGGTFYLRNSNTNGFADNAFGFGVGSHQPIAGDWNNDGVDTIGVYDSATGTFFLRNTSSTGAADMTFTLGIPGDVGIAGDWNGDGVDTVGVFRPSNGALSLKNTNATGFADIVATYGIPGDKPVTGDWDGNGTDTIGVYRGGTFYLRNTNTVGFADLVFTLGIPGDMPIAGDWDGLP